MRAFLSAVLLDVSATVSCAQVFSLYEVIDVGPTSGYAGSPGINDRGQVCFGSGRDREYGSIWDNGVVEALPDAEKSVPRRLNSRGDATGAAGNNAADLWMDGQARRLRDLTGLFAPVGKDINDSQLIAVESTSDGPNRAFVYDPATDILVNIGTFGGFAIPEAIDESGRVVGYSRYSDGPTRAFIWDSNAMRELAPDAFPMRNMFAYDSNEHGVAVGSLDTEQACVYVDGDAHLLPSIGENDWIAGLGINDAGLIVGMRRQEIGGFRAIVWDQNGAHGLESLVVNADGWIFEAATDINASGWICGTGTLNGIERSFALRPIPGPGVIAVMLLSCVGSAVARRRRASKPST